MMTIEDCRELYAREIQFAANLATPGLVEAFAKVPREKFLGPGPWQIGSAAARTMSIAGLGQMSYVTIEDPRDVYHNLVISLDRAKDLNNGQPGSLACWIDALALEPQILKGLTTGGLLKLKSVRRDAHEVGETCVVHRPDVCLRLVEVK